MTQVTIDQAMQIGVQHHQAGRLQQAEQLYRQILAQVPDHAPAIHHLGLLARQVGRHDIAVELIRRAIALRPDDAEPYSNLGLALKANGQLNEAIAAYHRAIALNPKLPEAQNNLGIALAERGHFDEAIAAYRQALALRPNLPEVWNNLGVVLGAARKLDEAVAAYQQGIFLRPNYADAYNNLGNALKDKGQVDEAVAAYRHAISFRPDFPEAGYNLGLALKAKGEFGEAIAAYRQVIALNPDLPEAQNNLGIALTDTGQLEEAIAAYRRAIALRPNYAEAFSNLAVALMDKGQVEQAISACRRAIAVRPDYPEAQYNLGNSLKANGQLEEAIAAYRQTIALNPKSSEAHNNLGIALTDAGRYDEALAACSKSVALNPSLSEAHNSLGNVLMVLGQLDQAMVAFRQALALKPDFAVARNNLGNVLKEEGRLDESIAAYRQAVASNPKYAGAHSNLVYTMHFHASYGMGAIAEELRRWNQQHAQPLQRRIRPLANDLDPDRRLKVGYISPDFREHVVGRFLLPLFEHHDHVNFEIACYANIRLPDRLTGQLRSQADRWSNIVGMSDEQLARRIRHDKIDVLVDLTMHMANNRLLVFARRPAPVQVTWLAYPGTTGLEAMDYRLTDRYLDPPIAMDVQTPLDGGEDFYSERSVRLPDSWFCYRPIPECPAVNPLPALDTRFVTFGCLNNFCKVTNETLVCWCRLLRDVPDSRLLLHAPEGSHQESVIHLLANEGVQPGRLRFATHLPIVEYFRLYQQIDICLDPFPYSGGTTSCDSLWMGVPVVSLAGRMAVGRLTTTILHNTGLPELSADSQEKYIQIAKDLAGNLSRLNQMRSGLRQRMQASPLMNESKFSRDIEAAYREMWRRWCSATPSPPGLPRPSQNSNLTG